jgi:hypothetical protein
MLLQTGGETIYGLTSISRANCLSEASFRPADVHLFGTGHPHSGQGIGGVFLCLLSFAQAKKVRRRQGPQPLHPLALIDGWPVASGSRPTFLAGQEK